MRTKVESTRPAVVLIASKQEWTGRSLDTILAPSGYTVLKSYTVRGAVERAKRDRPDAVIVDLQLPDGSGHELCQLLRAKQLVSPSTPILLTLPSPPTRRDRLAALRAGAWDCLSEPLDAEETLAILDALVPAKLDADRARSEGLLDEATGLYNVRGLTRRAKELASHAARTSGPLACVVLAPDPNSDDPAGALGEPPRAVVHLIARALKAAGRRSDAIGRLGASAFAVVALDTDGEQAHRVADRLCTAILAAPDVVAKTVPPFRLHAGCHGVSDFHTASIDAVELMFRATAALRKARMEATGA
jgi:diguanylate cyclase (GGDEF)-like protein